MFSVLEVEKFFSWILDTTRVASAVYKGDWRLARSQFVEKDTGGREGQALRDGACLPHPSANSLAPRPLWSIYIKGGCICAGVKGGGGG